MYSSDLSEILCTCPWSPKPNAIMMLSWFSIYHACPNLFMLNILLADPLMLDRFPNVIPALPELEASRNQFLKYLPRIIFLRSSFELCHACRAIPTDGILVDVGVVEIDKVLQGADASSVFGQSVDGFVSQSSSFRVILGVLPCNVKKED